MNEWENHAAAQSNHLEKNYKNLNDVFVSIGDNDKATKQAAKNKGPKHQGIIGIIEIKKIDVKLPILEGASLNNLSRAAGHLKGTAYPGEIGNSAIAAHRGYSYGRMFNRLNELKPSDQIIVRDKKKTFVYQVFESIIVRPDDLSILKGNGKDRILTLITCEPVNTGTHRLIIHAKLMRTF